MDFTSIIKTLAADYCLSVDEVKSKTNCFSEYMQIKGQRRFYNMDNTYFKVCACNSKLMFTGKAEITEECRKKYADTLPNWFFDVDRFRELEDILKPYNARLCQAHLFFLPGKNPEISVDGFQIVRYNREEINRFKDCNPYPQAFSFCENAPDMLGVAAVCDGEILGMAGACADSEYMWQIGINVEEKARGRGIASSLVTILKNDISAMGKIPYYGAAMSNIGSQRVALKSGFVPVWAELLSEKVKYE